MKLGPEGLRFVRPFASFGRGVVPFLPKGNTVHLQETALVIEGDLLRLKLPIVDRFVKRVFAEWSMLTIPYSRIEKYKFTRFRLIKILCWLLTFIVIFLAVGAALAGEPGGVPSLLMIGIPMSILSAIVQWRLDSRHLLIFRQANGKKGTVCFRIRAKRESTLFRQLLLQNQQTARG